MHRLPTSIMPPPGPAVASGFTLNPESVEELVDEFLSKLDDFIAKPRNADKIKEVYAEVDGKVYRGTALFERDGGHFVRFHQGLPWAIVPAHKCKGVVLNGCSECGADCPDDDFLCFTCRGS